MRSTLESVLNQDGVDLEVVVVDDGSTDGSAEIVADLHDPRVRMIPGPRRGIPASLNAGLEAARGEFIAQCDQDDLFPPNRLARQAAWLNQHPDFGAVCGYYTIVLHNGAHVADMGRGPCAEEVTDELRRGEIRAHFCAFATRTELLRKLGGFRTYFETAQDFDLQLRLGEITRVWYEPVHVLIHRIHDASVTHTYSRESLAIFASISREFQRQRLSHGQDDLERGCPPSPPSSSDGAPVPVGEEVQRLLRGEAWRAFEAGRPVRAVGLAMRSCLVRPTNLSAWVTLPRLIAVALLKRPRPPQREGMRDT